MWSVRQSSIHDIKPKAVTFLRSPSFIVGLSTAGASTKSTADLDENPFTTHPSHIHLSLVHSKDQLPKSYTITPPIKPWPKTLSRKRLVSMVSRQQNLDLAHQIFDFAGKFHPKFSHNFETYAAIITRLARARQFHHVESLLFQLRNSQIKCGETIFVILIRNYGLASRPKDAVRTFLQMGDFSVNRSVKSLNCLLNALVQNKKYDWVHLVFKNSRKNFGIIPNIFTGNILVKALCGNGDMNGALRVLDEMPGMGMVPNVVTYTTILGGYVGKGDMARAKMAFGEILDRGWVPDATTYTILMDGLCKKGKLIDAVKAMDEMEENGVEPNEVTYGVMIEAYCKAKKSGEALNLLGDMLEKKYIPSSVLCCKVIDILCEEGKVEDACQLWKKLLKKNVTPDNIISSALIYWLCKKGKISEAKKLFDEFERSSVPNVLTYNTLIAGLCESGQLCEAGRLWDDMVEKGCTPNAFTYNMFIKGFCKVGSPKEGIRVLEEMLEKGFMPIESTYSILIDGLSGSGSLTEIFELLFMVTNNGRRVDADFWRVLLNKAVGNVDTGAVLNNIVREFHLTSYHAESLNKQFLVPIYQDE